MYKNLICALVLLIQFYSFSQGWITTVPLKIKSSVNSNANELSPVFYVDSTTIYFTRNNEKKQYKGFLDQDIWMSTQAKVGVWNESRPVKELNNGLNNSVLGFNIDGTKVYLLDSYSEDKNFVDGIAISEKKGNGWSKPEHFLIEGLKVEGDFCGFTINKEENVLIISYSGPLSLGQEDLYACFKLEGNVWSAPIHLGVDVNTEGYEISPFLTYDSDTLFFASNGLGGLGSSDIFFSVRQDDTWQNWSKPKNLGAPINSSSFDAYYHSIGKRIFWSSDRDSIGGEDIFYVQKVKPPTLRVNVKEVKSITHYGSQDGGVDIEVDGGVAPYTYLWSNGSTEKDLKNVSEGEYVLTITDAVDQKTQVKVIVKTPEIDKGKDLALVFDPPIIIYYELDKWELTPDSKKSLEKLAELLNKHKEAKIEIRSYTDCMGTIDYNMKLSENRAKKTYEYLAEKVVNSERLSWRGYGESEPKIKCDCEKDECSEEDRKKNRRTEFFVLEF